MANLTLEQAYRLALSNHQSGANEEAAAICQQIVRHSPRHVQALALLGMIEGDAGRHEASLARFKAALAIEPKSPILHFNVGEGYRRWGKLAPAIRSFQKALDLDEEFFPALNSLGIISRAREGPAAALPWFQKAHALAPRDPELLNNLGGSLLELERFDEAIGVFEALEAIGRKSASLHVKWGTALTGLGRNEEARQHFVSALELDPNIADAHDNLATLLLMGGLPDEAAIHYSKAAELNPDGAARHNNLAGCLIKCGLLEDALRCYRTALKLDPGFKAAWDSFLYYLPYSANETPWSIAREFGAWNREITRGIISPTSTWHRQPTTDHRVRIGYVSPDFRNHVVSGFILPFLVHHDRSKYEVFCYSQVAKEDATTAQCREAADHWREIFQLDDETAAKTIDADKIDILVDLAMHSSGNRLGIFARKPAPIQCTYLATPSTTGLTTIDYRISDPWLDPEGSQYPSYSETTLRLPDIYGCYTPPAEVAIGDPPCIQRGFVTFGSLNNFCKVNTEVLSLWAEILSAVPHSRLLIVVPSAMARKQTRDHLLAKGIGPDRLLLRSSFPPEDYLAAYNQIDIALDPFPYQGVTTTFDALWMGCPVVSYAGNRAVERMALGILTTIGHPELVGRNRSDYVLIAADLAGDPERLTRFRSSLRKAMLASPLTDAKRLTEGLETLYQEMLRRGPSPAQG